MPDFGGATKRQGFRGVTRKVLSNSKHTLLLPLFGSNRKAFGLPEGHLAVLLRAQEIRQQTDLKSVVISAFKASISDAQAAQKKKGNGGMRKQESSYIRMNACKPVCVWVLVNAKACGHTHAGLQACPHSDQPAILLACRPVCLRACLPAHRQARRQAIRKQAGSNTMWKRY